MEFLHYNINIHYLLLYNINYFYINIHYLLLYNINYFYINIFKIQ